MEDLMKHDPCTRVKDHLEDISNNEHALHKPPPIRFRASEGGACSLAVWFRLMGFKPDYPFSGRGRLITNDGDVAHDVVRWQMQAAGCELFDLDLNDATGEVTETNFGRKEVEWNGETFEVTWRSDGGVVIGEDRCTLEIKSLDGWSFKYINDAHLLGKAMKYLRGKPPYKRAYNKYMKFFYQQAITGTMSGIENAYLLLKDRSMCDMFGLKYKIKPADFEYAMDGFAFVNERLRTGEPPMQEYTEKSKPCSFCPFRDRCWKKGDHAVS